MLIYKFRLEPFFKISCAVLVIQSRTIFIKIGKCIKAKCLEQNDPTLPQSRVLNPSQMFNGSLCMCWFPFVWLFCFSYCYSDGCEKGKLHLGCTSFIRKEQAVLTGKETFSWQLKWSSERGDTGKSLNRVFWKN